MCTLYGGITHAACRKDFIDLQKCKKKDRLAVSLKEYQEEREKGRFSEPFKSNLQSYGFKPIEALHS